MLNFSPVYCCSLYLSDDLRMLYSLIIISLTTFYFIFIYSSTIPDGKFARRVGSGAGGTGGVQGKGWAYPAEQRQTNSNPEGGQGRWARGPGLRPPPGRTPADTVSDKNLIRGYVLMF